MTDKPSSKNFIVRTRKMLGDAGEHYAVSQFTFAGCPATKMPDGWEGYDLAVEAGGDGLVRVSVKSRTDSPGWKTSKWFSFDQNRRCDWFVFLFVPSIGPIRGWVVPYDVACVNANNPGPNRKNAHMRDVSWAKLVKAPLLQYENNWTLKCF